jgi:hypothetical protein
MNALSTVGIATTKVTVAEAVALGVPVGKSDLTPTIVWLGAGVIVKGYPDGSAIKNVEIPVKAGPMGTPEITSAGRVAAAGIVVLYGVSVTGIGTRSVTVGSAGVAPPLRPMMVWPKPGVIVNSTAFVGRAKVERPWKRGPVGIPTTTSAGSVPLAPIVEVKGRSPEGIARLMVKVGLGMGPDWVPIIVWLVPGVIVNGTNGETIGKVEVPVKPGPVGTPTITSGGLGPIAGSVVVKAESVDGIGTLTVRVWLGSTIPVWRVAVLVVVETLIDRDSDKLAAICPPKSFLAITVWPGSGTKVTSCAFSGRNVVDVPVKRVPIGRPVMTSAGEVPVAGRLVTKVGSPDGIMTV